MQGITREHYLFRNELLGHCSLEHLIVVEAIRRPLNGTTQAGPLSQGAVRPSVRAYAPLRGRRKTVEDLGVSRHTLWRFLERDQMGYAVPSAVLSSVGNSVLAIETATLEIIIDMKGLRTDPAQRPLCARLEELPCCSVRNSPDHRKRAVPLQ